MRHSRLKARRSPCIFSSSFFTASGLLVPAMALPRDKHSSGGKERRPTSDQTAEQPHPFFGGRPEVNKYRRKVMLPQEGSPTPPPPPPHPRRGRSDRFPVHVHFSSHNAKRCARHPRFRPRGLGGRGGAGELGEDRASRRTVSKSALGVGWDP